MSANDLLLICPGCGTYGSLECFAAGADASAVSKLLGEMGPDLAKAMIGYVGLFRPAKRRATWAKTRRVIEQLWPLIQGQQIRFDGRDWTATRAVWISAMTSMAENPTLRRPLDGHNYLFKIIAGQANTEESVEEAKREAARRDASRSQGASRANTHGGIESTDAESAFRALVARAAVDLVGEIKVRKRAGQPVDRLSIVAHALARGYSRAAADAAYSRISAVDSSLTGAQP